MHGALKKALPLVTQLLKRLGRLLCLPAQVQHRSQTPVVKRERKVARPRTKSDTGHLLRLTSSWVRAGSLALIGSRDSCKARDSLRRGLTRDPLLSPRCVPSAGRSWLGFRGWFWRGGSCNAHKFVCRKERVHVFSGTKCLVFTQCCAPAMLCSRSLGVEMNITRVVSGTLWLLDSSSAATPEHRVAEICLERLQSSARKSEETGLAEWLKAVPSLLWWLA